MEMSKAKFVVEFVEAYVLEVCWTQASASADNKTDQKEIDKAYYVKTTSWNREWF